MPTPFDTASRYHQQSSHPDPSLCSLTDASSSGDVGGLVEVLPGFWAEQGKAPPPADDPLFLLLVGATKASSTTEEPSPISRPLEVKPFYSESLEEDIQFVPNLDLPAEPSQSQGPAKPSQSQGESQNESQGVSLAPEDSRTVVSSVTEYDLNDCFFDPGLEYEETFAERRRHIPGLARVVVPPLVCTTISWIIIFNN